MTTPAPARYTGYRFPAEIISHAVWLYFRFPLGLRMVEELLAARGIIVSHETDYNRRLDARRHQGADCIRRRDDLRDVEVDVGLKIDLLHRDAVEGLRLHVLNAVDAGTDRVLTVGGDALKMALRGYRPARASSPSE